MPIYIPLRKNNLNSQTVNWYDYDKDNSDATN